MTEYSGVFLGGFLAIQTCIFLKGSPDIKYATYLIKAVTWGICGLLTVKHWEKSKKPNAYVNLGLQVVFTALWGASTMAMA